MKDQKLSRRNFLLASGAATAGAATLIATQGKVAKPTADAAQESAKSASGYHLSAHINKYYKTTTI